MKTIFDSNQLSEIIYKLFLWVDLFEQCENLGCL